jgi:hypothetical protein
MKKKLKTWLKMQEKRYAWRKKTFTTQQYPEYNQWLIGEIKPQIKGIPLYHKQAAKEFIQQIQKDILWMEMLKGYLKEIK